VTKLGAHLAAGAIDADLMALIDGLEAATRADRRPAGEIARAYSNLACMRGYCDVNARFFEDRAARCWRELVKRDREVLSALERSLAASSGEKALRSAWIDWLKGRIDDASDWAASELVRRRTIDALEHAETARADLLDRLSLRGDTSTPTSVALFSAMSRIDSARTREKLMRVWRKASTKPLNAVVDLVDQNLAVRRRLARRRGFASVLDQTLSRGGPRKAEIAAFLQRYATAALTTHQHLSARLVEEFGCTDEPLVHFPRFLATAARGVSATTFDFEHCVAFLLDVIAKQLRIEGRITWRGCVLDITIAQSGEPRGRISIDSVASETASRLLICDEPWARVLRRTHRNGQGREVMSFDAVQSLFHEFGHALSHVLAPHPSPSVSALDYLPSERLEQLSTWCEMWAFDQSFGVHVRGDADALVRCRAVRALEFERGRLERVATAMLDFALHCSERRGLRSTFDALSRRYPLVFAFPLVELAHHFTTLTFAENGGASFAYLWGGGVAAEAHCEGGAGPDVLSGQAAVPAVEAVFDFYRSHAQWGAA
jgi:oligopeptidase A